MSRHDSAGPPRLLRGNAVLPKDDTQERFDALCGPVTVTRMVGCEECGNDDATVTITNGQKVCSDCAERLDP